MYLSLHENQVLNNVNDNLKLGEEYGFKTLLDILNLLIVLLDAASIRTTTKTCRVTTIYKLDQLSLRAGYDRSFFKKPLSTVWIQIQSKFSNNRYAAFKKLKANLPSCHGRRTRRGPRGSL